MPPQKERAKTLQEKFGFVDEELKTPQHDAMMVWIDQQAESLIQEYFSISSGWPDDTIARVRAEADRVVKSHFHKLQWTGLGEPPPIKLKILEKIWESPIVTKSGFAVGFADMEVIVIPPGKLSCTWNEQRDPQKSDLPSWTCVENKESVIFEAKTSIRSVGELIRQIRLYQEYRKGHYIVVSPDDKFADVLRGQEIQFVKYED
jgi:hypothetical protein